ncbi:ribonuclease H-like domain-containing protein, partial [Tanacetum coccineum]
MGSHTLQQLKRLSCDELKVLFETTMRMAQTFLPIESEGDKTVPELTTGSSKRDAEDLVNERFSITKPTDDKEKELWVELKRLFEPDSDDTLWKLQRYMHDPLVWRIYDTCGVHHVSSVRGHEIFMLVEKDYPLSKGVIVNGDFVSSIASASASAEGPIPPKTAEQKLARKYELKAKSTLMLAIPDEHLLKFHVCKDANQEGLDQTYDRFQKLISQLEIHGEVISQKDANLKLLRSLPSAWNNIALIMRNKSDLDTLIMDDLYNNLKVTNEIVTTAHSVSAASSKDQASTASYVDDVMFSFFSNQSKAPQLDYKDLEQIDADDLEEMDLKWQVAMLTIRVKRFIKKTGRKMDLNDKETVGFDRTKVECYNCHRRGHFARECRAPRNQGNRNRDAPRRNAPMDTTTTNALVVQDGICGYDWSFQAEEGITNFALMAYTSQGSSSSLCSNSE